MLLSLVQRYSLKLVFTLALLLGIQIPNFLQQYEHRLDAHYIEAKHQLQQYQNLADLYFDGSLQALITKHKNSRENLFQDEALLIENLMERFNYLQEQKDRLLSPVSSRLYHLLAKLNSPLFIETKNNYQADIVLNKNAITVGLIFALLSTILFELFFYFICLLVKKVFSPRSVKQ
ncbi:DUF2937 family protein [Psychromonas ossibalaenae]|uniref:DUF2937 family protein n=1 Tax=Psychromonas ossibalaenae TaxID=444922 RepID=UPI00037FCB6B|nr:DUF2937 family protein [Psychromonas ossibalaenae]